MVIDLILTGNCNLRCKYCFENRENCKVNLRDEQVDSSDMNYETAIKSIEYFKNIAIKNRESILQINFFGGEPLLKFNIIKDIVNYCNKNIDDIKCMFSMTTNATLFNEEICDYCIENNFTIMFSIDGNKISHNKNRLTNKSEGSFYLIEKNLNFITKFINTSKKSQIKYILNPNNINYFYESMIYLSKFNSPISFDFNYEELWKQEDIDIFQKEFEKYLKFYKEKREIIGSEFNSIEIERILKALSNYEINKYCNAGETMFAINFNGDIYPCSRFILEINGVLGNIYKNHKTIEMENNINYCNKCQIKKYCNAQCKFINKLYTGNILKPPKFFCDIQKILFYYIYKTFV